MTQRNVQSLNFKRRKQTSQCEEPDELHCPSALIFIPFNWMDQNNLWLASFNDLPSTALNVLRSILCTANFAVRHRPELPGQQFFRNYPSLSLHHSLIIINDPLARKKTFRNEQAPEDHLQSDTRERSAASLPSSALQCSPQFSLQFRTGNLRQIFSTRNPSIPWPSLFANPCQFLVK